MTKITTRKPRRRCPVCGTPYYLIKSVQACVNRHIARLEQATKAPAKAAPRRTR